MQSPAAMETLFKPCHLTAVSEVFKMLSKIDLGTSTSNLGMAESYMRWKFNMDSAPCEPNASAEVDFQTLMYAVWDFLNSPLIRTHHQLPLGQFLDLGEPATAADLDAMVCDDDGGEASFVPPQTLTPIIPVEPTFVQMNEYLPIAYEEPAFSYHPRTPQFTPTEGAYISEDSSASDGIEIETAEEPVSTNGNLIRQPPFTFNLPEHALDFLPPVSPDKLTVQGYLRISLLTDPKKGVGATRTSLPVVTDALSGFVISFARSATRSRFLDDIRFNRTHGTFSLPSADLHFGENTPSYHVCKKNDLYSYAVVIQLAETYFIVCMRVVLDSFNNGFARAEPLLTSRNLYEFDLIFSDLFQDKPDRGEARRLHEELTSIWKHLKIRKLLRCLELTSDIVSKKYPDFELSQLPTKYMALKPQ